MGRHKGYGVSRLVLIAAAAPSLIKRPNFPYGIDEETVLEMIEGTYNDRPQMLKNFGDRFFFQRTSQAFSNWFFQLGLQAAGWATAAIAKTWINESIVCRYGSYSCATLIIHGIHDKVVPFQLGEIQQRMIRNSRLVPFELPGMEFFMTRRMNSMLCWRDL